MKKLLLIFFIISGCNIFKEQDIHGCTDATACNYNVLANKSDYSCEYEIDCVEICTEESNIDECYMCIEQNQSCAFKWKLLSSTLIDSAIAHDTFHDVHTYTFLAYANAILNGWSHIRTSEYLNKAYSVIDNYGYGLGASWDAFNDGTVNDANTNYSVTMTTYVGYPFIEGYISGEVPDSKLIHIIETLLTVPLADTLGNGECWSYSDNPNDVVGCVHNINIGVAYFFQEVMKLNLTEYNLNNNINSIIEREIHSYLPNKTNYLYWDGRPSVLTDQHHLAYQGWHMINIENEELNKIGHEIIDYISYNRKKDISSLIGQLVALQYNDYDSDSLYNIIDQLLLGNETDYTEISYYTMSNPRVLAHYALWSAKYYDLLTK